MFSSIFKSSSSNPKLPNTNSTPPPPSSSKPVTQTPPLSPPVPQQQQQQQTMSATTAAVSSLPSPPDITSDLIVVSDDRISRGPYADLWVGFWGGRSKALIKVMHVLQDPTAQQKAHNKLVQALKVWNKIKHRNVMQLFGICYVTGEHLALVLPFYEHGSLLVFLTDDETASKLDKMKLIMGVAAGLECLHEEGVIHGDLRSSTVMVDAAGDPILANFGQRQIILETAGMSASASDGCARWMAPEVLLGEYVTYKTDIYAFASVCMEIITQTIPYPYVDDDTDVVNYVVQYRLPTHPFTESINFQDDNPLWNLMQGCWNKHPNLRPTAVEVAREVTRVKAALAQFQLAKQFLNMSVSTPKEDKGDDSDGEGYV